MNSISLAQADPHVLAETNVKSTDSPAKIKDAAQQFESLLLTQILQSAHEGGGWMGTGDGAGGAASSFAEQQLAGVIAKSGGLGLSKMIAAGLQRTSHPE